MFTFTDLQEPNADVTFVSLYTEKLLKSGRCQNGMVEFLTTSGIYQLHKNVNYELEGHVF